jgi:hypothetical protein
VFKKNSSAQFAVLFPVLLVCLNACTPDPAAMESESRDERPKVFSSSDRRVAQALTLGGKSEQGAQSPADQATTCVVALNLIRKRMSGSVISNKTYTDQLDRVIKLYRDRAGANSMPADQFAEKLRTAENAAPEESDQAMTAVRCLKALEKQTP